MSSNNESKDGSSNLYQADDQRTVSNTDVEEAKRENRFHEGKENSHKANDSKDQRTIANKLASAEKRDKENEEDSEEVAALKEDPTAPARLHGNEPSKGAKIDAQIQKEEEEELRRKGKLN